MPEETRLLKHGCDLAKAWEKFQRQLPEEHRLPLRGKPPNLSTLFESIEVAQKRWQAARDGTKFGRVKSTFAKVARSMEDHGQILEVIPNNDKYVSLITGSMACIVKVGHDPEPASICKLMSSRPPSITKMLPWRLRIAWSNYVKISCTGRSRSLPIQISHQSRKMSKSFTW